MKNIGQNLVGKLIETFILGLNILGQIAGVRVLIIPESDNVLSLSPGDSAILIKAENGNVVAFYDTGQDRSSVSGANLAILLSWFGGENSPEDLFQQVCDRYEEVHKGEDQ